ncbi:hypothetical protein [Nocardiopsis sp. RV163]|uniref:hypothetical protein n=1 Tax=Nocardiopsis sp. RV163 TaxID=1661388 RepID=UPI00064C3858|nr:hypothetical protein [Nocardiopsis sp. RV163]
MPFFPPHGRFALTPAVSLSLVFALSACGGGEDPAEASSPSEEAVEETTAAEGTPPEALSQEELAGLLVEAPVPVSRPQVDESALPAEPESSASVSERAAWALLTEVTRKASRVDPGAAAACPEQMTEPVEPGLSCTLTYGGLDMQFPVLSGDGGAAFRFEYPELPTVREVVEDTIRFDHGVEAVYCDMDDVVAVEPGAERAPYLCYARDGGLAGSDSPEDAVSPYEVFVLIGGTLATYQYLDAE